VAAAAKNQVTGHRVGPLSVSTCSAPSAGASPPSVYPLHWQMASVVRKLSASTCLRLPKLHELLPQHDAIMLRPLTDWWHLTASQLGERLPAIQSAGFSKVQPLAASAPSSAASLSPCMPTGAGASGLPGRPARRQERRGQHCRQRCVINKMIDACFSM
jgi:hypothetical protein